MAHYLRIGHEGEALGVWLITDAEAIRLGVTNPREGPGCYFKAEPGETIFAAVRRGAAGWFGANGECPFHRITLDPGQYYPRMARPIDQHPHESPGYYPALRDVQPTVAMTRGQLAVLSRSLERICQTVHPSAENMAAFGHDIRNLLLLAATEVEAQWKGILVANGANAARFTTADYVKLLGPMQLASYRIGLTEYPWLPVVAPFETWDPAAPTQSLAWYAAYNATKHDREEAFSAATLEHAIAAVCAIAALIAAQYGVPYGLGQRTELADRFKVIAAPAWLPADVYIYPYSDGPHTEAARWTPVMYPF